MENTLILSKLKLLFEKILKTDYVMNKYYAENLFTKINRKDPDVDLLKSMCSISELMLEALNHFEKCHNTVQVFIIRMLGVMCDKESNFNKIFCKNGDFIVQAFNQIKEPSMNPSLRVAYLEVAVSLVNHNSGVCWLYENVAWQNILSLCNETRTVFVVRQTYKFASTFIWKINNGGDIEKVETVLNFIMKPVLETDFLTFESITADEEDEINKMIEPMLQILLSIVSNIEEVKKGHNILMELLLKESKIIKYCYVLLGQLRRDDITLLITKLMFSVLVARVINGRQAGSNLPLNEEDYRDLGITYLNISHNLIRRNCATLLFDFSYECNLIWMSAWQGNPPPVIYKDSGKKMELHNQILIILLVPSIVYATLGKSKSMLTNDTVDEYLDKLMGTVCEHSARAAYALRDLTLQSDALSVTLQSIKRLNCLRDNLSNEQANLVFQALFYVLKEYDPMDENGEIKSEMCFDDSDAKVSVMTYVLDTLLSLVKNYNINWQESFEILCLYNVVYNILKRPNLTYQFTSTAFHVIAMTVKKFLPPNLSLLMDSQPGSTMHELGQLIFLKMHDLHWEVRDSVLQLLQIVTEISYIKYPPFQKQILANNLINVAACLVMNDHESYVRASALKCLGAATKITNIWDHLKVQYPNIEVLLLCILVDNSEGIVRREACNVLCDMYQNNRVPPNLKQSLYQHMITAALKDLHWEVQLSALRFWKSVIQSNLNAQGMLDGTFPPVTFSKETRKIVTLNEKEIQKRLLRTLDDLSSIGCLTVLVKLLHIDSDVEILESAFQIAMDFLEILNLYKVPENVKPCDSGPQTVEELDCDTGVEVYTNNDSMEINEPSTMDKADEVIDSILKVNDVSLLANIYERHLNLDQVNGNVEEDPQHLAKLLKLASPRLFISFLQSKDFKAVIEKKKNWRDGIKSLSSLLDDILGIYEFDNDVNSLDCY